MEWLRKVGGSVTTEYYWRFDGMAVHLGARAFSTPDSSAWIGGIYDVTRFPSRATALDALTGFVTALHTAKWRKRWSLVRVTRRSV